MLPRRAVSRIDERRLDVEDALEGSETLVCATLHSVTRKTRLGSQVGVVCESRDKGGLEAVGATPILIMRLGTGIRIDTEEDTVAIEGRIRFLMGYQRRIQTETTLTALLGG